MKQKRIAVIGTGSAGLLTAAHLTTWLDDSWQVSVVHNPEKPILGIGESTNGGFISVLERATNFSLAYPADLDALDATIKYGSKFTSWRKHGWVNPLLSGNIAIHFNNRRLRNFVVERLTALWPRQFSVLEADVQEVQNYADHVTLRTDRGLQDFDYVVDCMGTPASFDNYTLSDCTLMDAARSIPSTTTSTSRSPTTSRPATAGCSACPSRDTRPTATSTTATSPPGRPPRRR